jgi:tetratricopeptide (TPR) repeat protein
MATHTVDRTVRAPLLQETIMGLFDRLFGSDPKKGLAKAEEWLAKGRPDRALEMARKAANSDEIGDPDRAHDVARRAREQLLANALEMAATAEDSEFWEDALDWVDRALEQVDTPEKRAELEARRLEIEEKSQVEDEVVPVVEAEDVDDEIGAEGLHPDDHFDALVDMLDEEVAEAYRSQGEVFRDAYLELHAGQPEKALETLDALVDEAPDDPVRRFERGRARLLRADAPGAQEDFEAAWDQWGEIYLDRAGSLSVAGLWAEALLDQKKPEPILERLADVAQPRNGQPDLSLPYAIALVMAEKVEEATAFLGEAIGRFKEPDFPHLLGQLLVKDDRPDEAVQVLETAIAPSCASGNCAKPPLHVPTARSLIDLYLGREEPSEADLERTETLFTHLAQRLGGRLGWQDRMLLAKLRHHEGDEEAAAEEKAEAERLKELAQGQLEKADVQMRPQAGQQKAVL